MDQDPRFQVAIFLIVTERAAGIISASLYSVYRQIGLLVAAFPIISNQRHEIFLYTDSF